MVNYEVTVYTGDRLDAGSFNNVLIRLVGTDGKSKPTKLISKEWFNWDRAKVSSFTVSCHKSFGKLVLIELKIEHGLLLSDDWFVDKVEITDPEEQSYKFPIYHWISDNKVHCFREGTALRVFDDTEPLCRPWELDQRKKDYQWDVYKDGVPHCIKAGIPQSLPSEVQFSFTKETEFFFLVAIGMLELKLEGLDGRAERWPDMDDIIKVLPDKYTTMSEYVKKHWKKDAFFGYQFLNGVNPMIIRRCKTLPIENFPVTDNMVSLPGSSLEEEIKEGNIFLCDYKNLDGLKPNTINGKEQYLMAPFVLLHKTSDNKLMPVAIQLKQTPAEDNPIFVPGNSEWLLAKTFVRSADFNEHEVNSHLLRTHLLAEVFTGSLLRNVPMVHPLYKLLVPHTRYTLQINILARSRLISKNGAVTENAACGGEAMIQILQRSLSSLTYTSLCIHDDIADRGLESVPNFYYRDDGLKLWDIIHRFVKGILEHYYKTDDEVQKDSELQNWIGDIYEHGFLSNKDTGIPQSFSTVDELVKFVTMVIFTCSAQHSAVNTGQFDYGDFMPNRPFSLQRPPPTTKGDATEDTLLQTLPDINTTVHGMSVLWLLSKQSSDFVSLGNYPEEHFTEETPCRLIEEFQGELKGLSDDIKTRNRTLEILYKYTYLDPDVMENSVSL